MPNPTYYRIISPRMDYHPRDYSQTFLAWRKVPFLDREYYVCSHFVNPWTQEIVPMTRRQMQNYIGSHKDQTGISYSRLYDGIAMDAKRVNWTQPLTQVDTRLLSKPQPVSFRWNGGAPATRKRSRTEAGLTDSRSSQSSSSYNSDAKASLFSCSASSIRGSSNENASANTSTSSSSSQPKAKEAPKATTFILPTLTFTVGKPPVPRHPQGLHRFRKFRK